MDGLPAYPGRSRAIGLMKGIDGQKYTANPTNTRKREIIMQAIIQVDAFINRPFRGNPAAVCILREARDAQWMQNIALEMNLSETAFLVEQKDGFDLRWFTPACEVDLCGHATLASAHVLWETGVLSPSQEARFHTRSGLLSALKKGEWIEMNFPTEPANPCEYPTELREALGLAPAIPPG